MKMRSSDPEFERKRREHAEEECSRRFIIEASPSQGEYLLTFLRGLKETTEARTSTPGYYFWNATHPKVFHVLNYLKECGHIEGWGNDSAFFI